MYTVRSDRRLKPKGGGPNPGDSRMLHNVQSTALLLEVALRERLVEVRAPDVLSDTPDEVRSGRFVSALLG